MGKPTITSANRPSSNRRVVDSFNNVEQLGDWIADVVDSQIDSVFDRDHRQLSFLGELARGIVRIFVPDDSLTRFLDRLATEIETYTTVARRVCEEWPQCSNINRETLSYL